MGKNHFITFCLTHGLIGPTNPLLPASEIPSIYFAAHLAKSISYTSKLYLVGIQDLHGQPNFPLKLHKMYRLQKVLTGIKRCQNPKKFTLLCHNYPNFDINFQLLSTFANLQCRPLTAMGCLYFSLFSVFSVLVNSLAMVPLLTPRFIFVPGTSPLSPT